MKTSIFFFAVAWLLGTAALAQPSPTTAASGIQPPAPTASQLRAAETLLDAVYTEKSFEDLITGAVDAQIKLHPEIKPYQAEMLTFMHKYLSWSALKPQMAVMYSQEFTEPELVEITRFYQSPVGRKAASKLPIMMQKGMAIGQHQVQAHRSELEELIKEKQARDENAAH